MLVGGITMIGDNKIYINVTRIIDGNLSEWWNSLTDLDRELIIFDAYIDKSLPRINNES